MTSQLRRASAAVESRQLPRHVAVIGAAGGLDQGMFDALWASGDRFHGRRPCTAERIVDAPVESQAAAISSLADGLALARGAAMMHAGPEPCLA